MDELHGATAGHAGGLLERLMRSGRLTEARLDLALADAGLSVAKWAALKHLAQAAQPLPLGQLAERLACVKSNATQLTDRLEAERLVRRAPDPEDRRCIRVELTAEGRQRYEAGAAVLRTMERELLGDYTLEEQRQFAHLLARLESSGRIRP